ncbi:Heat shock protein DnaJ- N-terminal with domain of unknown function (DUF1977 [Striga hermonthica]|uniref:J domain-containing protein n=1 Tax=Striga hermonthica TaxID=68872 RepID=A0A9N7R285_STRHE|nr:Heat shock protein DnaJ- N-terminal with domain of unknown function (DUF1977 [Striga hermonthica]
MDGNNENRTRRSRRKGSPLVTLSSSAAPAAGYTEEHVGIVKHIMTKTNDYYQILGIQRTCTNDQVCKAYKKIYLKIHPDKNHAPGANKAFRLVNKAYQCLSDQKKRKKYDLLGREDGTQEEDRGRILINLVFEFLATILWGYPFFFWISIRAGP